MKQESIEVIHWGLRKLLLRDLPPNLSFQVREAGEASKILAVSTFCSDESHATFGNYLAGLAFGQDQLPDDMKELANRVTKASQLFEFDEGPNVSQGGGSVHIINEVVPTKLNACYSIAKGGVDFVLQVKIGKEKLMNPTAPVVNIDDYRSFTRKTAIFTTKTYPALGLCNEVAEFYEKVILEASLHDLALELGDCLWYLFALCDTWGIGLDELLSGCLSGDVSEMNFADLQERYTRTHNRAVARLIIQVGKVAGILKKTERDCEGILNTEKRAEKRVELIAALSEVLGAMVSVCRNNNMCLQTVANMNVSKLTSRQERGVIGGSGDHR